MEHQHAHTGTYMQVHVHTSIELARVLNRNFPDWQSASHTWSHDIQSSTTHARNSVSTLVRGLRHTSSIGYSCHHELQFIFHLDNILVDDYQNSYCCKNTIKFTDE